MTDHGDDDAATGIPERIERADADPRVSESGRHITNRNVVPRAAAVDRSDAVGQDRLRPNDDAFDLVTPVRPQPRDVFEEEDATLTHDDGSAPPRLSRVQILPVDAGFTPRDQRGPATERMPHADRPDARPLTGGLEPRITPSAGYRMAEPRPPESRPAGPRASRLTPDGGFVPPESRRPGSQLLDPLDDDERRPVTKRGHVEPQRLPTQPTPPPPIAGSPADAAAPTQLIGDRGSGSYRLPSGQLPRASTADPLGEPAQRPLPGQSARMATANPTGERSGSHRLPSGQHPRASTADPAPEPGSQRPETGQPISAAPGVDWLADRQRGFPRPASGRGEPAGEPSPYEQLAGGRDYDRPPSGSGAARSLADDRDDLVATVRRRTGRSTARRTLSPRVDYGLRGLAIAAMLGLGAAGLAMPSSVLYGGIAWLVFLICALSGWGALVVRIARIADPDLGLRAALGAAGYLAVAGPLLAIGVLNRPALLALLAIGAAAFAWRQLTTPVAAWQRVADGMAFLRARPALAVVIGVLGALACVRIVGAIATLDRNPWDDDIAYTPFIKRLLDTGDLIEPFSFRRLGAYGGQTALQALAAARGSLASVHLLDKGLGFAVALLALLGHARARRTQPLWLALAALVVLLLPDTAINTASYWTGAAVFIALYRLIAAERWALVGLVAAAACTLRQNFLATAALVIACALVIRLVALARTMPWREAWHQERRNWALAAGVAALVLVPWMIAAYRASDTFLFPLLDGTWNHQLSLKPAVTTGSQELAFLVVCCLEATPIVVMPIVAVVLAFIADRRPGRPLASLAIASALAFALLVHSFLGSEAYHLWRYAFGFATPLAALLVLEVGAEGDDVALAPLGRWLVLAAMVLQVVLGRGALPKQAVALFDSLREAAAIDRHGDPSARVERSRYAALQAALPAGAPTVVMLDDPALLDYRRNPIANLDTPGFASPGAQLPAFAGAEPLRAYLVARGYRYAAFVRSERSRYCFRREFWVERMFTDAELYQVMSAYTIDAIDSFAELATTTKVVYDDDGLVAIDLATPLRDASRRKLTGDEPARRTAWTRELADREGLHDAWSLTSRADLRFEDGTGPLRFADGAIDDPRWYELTHPRPEPARRGTAILPIQRRAHLRVRAPDSPRDMRLSLRAAIALATIHTHPRLDISLDGELLGSVVADPTGHYAIDLRVAAGRLSPGWHDLYLVLSSIADPEKDVRELRIARLEAVEWSP